MSYFLVAVLTFLLSLVVSLAFTPIAQKLSHRLDIVAVPGGRRKHSGRIPKLGGIPLFCAFLVSGLFVYGVQPMSSIDATYLRGILVGALFLFGASLLDDYYDLPWWVQYGILASATFIAFRHDLIFETFTLPGVGIINLNQDFPRLALLFVPLLTLLWISGMMVTVNWLDGLDGLATGIGIIAILLIFGHSLSLAQITSQWSIAIFPLALAGGLIGFLFFNFAPAKIFLGSAGAYLIGFGIATLALIAPAKIATALLVMGIPILDVIWQIQNRIRQGKSPFSGDRGHLHFRLSDLGYDTKVIVVGYYTVSAAFGAIALFAPGIWKLVMLALLSIGVLLFFSRLNRIEPSYITEE